jgi:hypothetical protein
MLHLPLVRLADLESIVYRHRNPLTPIDMPIDAGLRSRQRPLQQQGYAHGRAPM